MLEVFFFTINNLMLIKNINKETTAMIIGPLLGFIVGAYSIVNGFDIPAGITLWITVWTAIWWVFEAVPIPVASLVPLSMLSLIHI